MKARARPVANPRNRKPQKDPELIFFTGKGGVGKTTIAASYATWRANSSPSQRVLLLSTDPAHSLGDVFERKFAPKPTSIRVGQHATLTIHEVDAERRFGSFLEQYREPLVAAIESGTVFTRDEIEPLLSSTLPGMSEMAALLAINDALCSGEFHCIVVDTAPFGHTLRLFQLPESFRKLLRFLTIASGRDAILAAHFAGRAPAPNPLIAEWQSLLEALLVDLRRRARLVLVTTPEPFALNESKRVSAEMRTMTPALQFHEIVLNRVVRESSGCKLCHTQHLAVREAQRFLARTFPKLPVRIAPDPGGPILGVEMLLKFGRQVFGGRHGPLRGPSPKAAKPRIETTSWPEVEQQISITVGKGGVGKTTVSAAMAAGLRKQERAASITVCSTDPAPSLDDVFGQQVGAELEPVGNDSRLLAAEIDAPAEFHAWAARMNDRIAGALSTTSGGVHIDLSFDRQLFSALLDVVPPGLDEVFGVLRITELVRSQAANFLILDMAPTGHALEMLRTPDRILHWSRLLLKSLATHRTLPFARDVGVEIAKFSSDVRWLAGRLRSKKATAAWVVMLAEPLPDRETARLLTSLEELGIAVQGVIVNRLLLQPTGQCRRCKLRAAWQWSSLARLKKSVLAGVPIYCVPEHGHGISGVTALQRFLEQIWRLA